MSDAEKRSAEIAARALDGHRRWHGKMQTLPKCPVDGIGDFALWYTPGVAAAAAGAAVAEGLAQRDVGPEEVRAATLARIRAAREDAARCVPGDLSRP